MLQQICTEPADRDCDDLWAGHYVIAPMRDHIIRTHQRERGMQRKIGRGIGKDNIHTEARRERTETQTNMYSLFRLGWREEEEGEKGQKESRGRNEGVRNVLLYQMVSVAAPVKGCRKTMPCIYKRMNTP